MDLKKLFTTRMFPLLTIPVVFIGICVLVIGTGTYGINKTVGWAWDLTNLTILAFPLYFIYWIGYGLLFLFGVKTNYRLSVGHFVSIFIGFVYFNNLLFNNLKAMAIILGLVFFIANIVASLVNQVKLNRSRI